MEEFNLTIKELHEMADELTPAMLEEGKVILIHKNRVGAFSPQMFGMFGKTFTGVRNINPDTFNVEHEYEGITYILKVRTWMCSKIEMKYDYYLVDSKNRMDKLIDLLGNREINGTHFTIEQWLESCTYKRYSISRIIRLPKREDYTTRNVSWMAVESCEKLENYNHWLNNVIKL